MRSSNKWIAERKANPLRFNRLARPGPLPLARSIFPFTVPDDTHGDLPYRGIRIRRIQRFPLHLRRAKPGPDTMENDLRTPSRGGKRRKSW